MLKKSDPVIITKHTKLCSLHFTDDDYYHTKYGTDVLKPDSVPSKIFGINRTLLKGV